jgi:hypothetical protein
MQAMEVSEKREMQLARYMRTTAWLQICAAQTSNTLSNPARAKLQPLDLFTPDSFSSLKPMST